MKTFFNWINSF